MLGILTILSGAFALTLHNVTVRVLFSEHLVLGLLVLGGYVQPTLQNSFLLMVMRMLFVVPLMAALSPKLYPNAFKELRQLLLPERRPVLRQALICGVLMFLNVAGLYIAIGSIPAGIAMTLFCTYPVFTALLSWRLFGDRPTLFRWSVMGIILLGTALTIPQSSAAGEHYLIVIGTIASIGSGVIYAFYSVIAQKCFEQLHPVPFTWISFAITLFLSIMSVLLYPRSDFQLEWTPLWIGGLFSGFISFVGHTLNNLGIRMIGATTASMVGSSGPALTALVAWATIRETLDTVQILGILIVTLGIALLSSERMWMKRSQI
ncbi:MAG TPA: DMT family transporter [Crinalium sp.]